jgi:uncharacterized protein (TIGR03435 family)
MTDPTRVEGQESVPMTIDPVVRNPSFGRKCLLVAAGWMVIAAPMTFGQASAAPAKPEGPGPLPAMAADADPSFEVATIKPRLGGSLKAIGMRGRDFHALNSTLSELIGFAYGLQSKQIVGGPAWLDKGRFDINGIPDAEGQPSTTQWKAMVRKLMADRFNLKLHQEKQELAVFALVVGKNGPKLKKNESGDPYPGHTTQQRVPDEVKWSVLNMTMEEFASMLQNSVVDRPVLDRTGITGRFDFECSFAASGGQVDGIPLPQGIDTNLPDLFTAVQEQLGLKLESTKGQVPVLIIDHAELPSEN